MTRPATSTLTRSPRRVGNWLFFIRLSASLADSLFWGYGGTGRRRRLKISRPDGCGGSTPSIPTKKIFDIDDNVFIVYECQKKTRNKRK